MAHEYSSVGRTDAYSLATSFLTSRTLEELLGRGGSGVERDGGQQEGQRQPAFSYPRLHL